MDILKYKTIVIKIGSSLIVDGKNKIKKNCGCDTKCQERGTKGHVEK